MNLSITHDLEYLALFSFVLIFPKVLLRYQIPSGITALFIGVVAAYFDPKLKTDQLFKFLSQIGITSLFLFAGLEIEIKELKENRSYIFKYLIQSFIILGFMSFGMHRITQFPVQDSIIFCLGIFTPSAGFIINTLKTYDLTDYQEYWVKSKAISKEILAILILFLAMQGGDLKTLAISSGLFLALILTLPYVFKFFFRFISPFAPNSEIPFLVVLSLITGVLSKELGAYYLVGAFVVGIIGSTFKEEIFHEGEESIFKALSGFFGVFLPFYFFFAGLKISIEAFNLKQLILALGFIVLFIPLRFFYITFGMKTFLKTGEKGEKIISLFLLPNLIFGIVIAGILLEREAISLDYVYALLIYTIASSIIPALFFRPDKQTLLSDSK